MGTNTRMTLLAVLCAALVVSISSIGVLAQDPNIDLGSFAVTNPKISVTYTQPVKIDVATLTYLGQTRAVYQLCILPAPTGYAKQYDLYALQDGTYGVCEEQPIPLQTGDYLLTLSAYDSNTIPSQANPPDQRTFKVTGMEIKMLSPTFGVSTNQPINVHLYTHETISGVDTPREATCKWTDNKDLYDKDKYDDITNTAASSDKINHQILFPGRGTLYVLCKESPSNRITYGRFEMDFDKTPPQLKNLNVTPATISDSSKKYAAITLDTDDDSTCIYKQIKPTVSAAIIMFPRDNSRDPEPKGPGSEDPAVRTAYGTYHEVLIRYDQINDELPHEYTYEVECTNLAGLKTKNQAIIKVKLNGAVVVISPGTVVNKTDYPLTVQATFEPASCKANNVAMEKYDDDNSVYNLDLKDQTDGKHTYNIVCSLGTKTVSTSFDTIVDTAIPTAPTIKTDGAVCDRNITARFKATDPKKGNAVPTGILYYNYTVTDNNGWSYNGRTATDTATVALLEDVGNVVTWEVYAVDGAENEGTHNTTLVNDLHQGQDEECGLPPFISLKMPEPMGFTTSKEKNYDMIIETTRPSTCGYKTEQTVQSVTDWSLQLPLQAADDGTTHTKSVSFDNKRILFNCTEDDGTAHKKIFRIGRDYTRPTIAVTVKPSATINDPALGIVTVTVQTDDPTYCTLDDDPFTDLPDTDEDAYLQMNTKIMDYSSAGNGAKTLTIECKNLGQLSSVKKQNIVINYNARLNITVIEPKATTSDETITLRVQPNKLCDCTYAENATADPQEFTSTDEGVHSVTLGTLEDGSYSYIVSCTVISDGSKGVINAQFTVDKSVPTIDLIEGPASFCIGDTASSGIRSGTANDTAGGTVSYKIKTTTISAYSTEYSLEGPSSTTFQGNSTTDVISISTKGLDVGSYTLSAKLRSDNGRLSDQVSISIEALPEDAAACIVSADHCENGELDAGEEKIDCGGTCEKACVSCASDSDCMAGEICENDVCIAQTACFNDADCKAGEYCSSGVCADKFGNPCTNGILDYGEEDVDCGGTCDQCKLCSDSSPCDDGYVCSSNGNCVPAPKPTCNDDEMNGDETGVDCGGRCPLCGGVGCQINDDCSNGQTCAGGQCIGGDIIGCIEDIDCNIDAGEICVDGLCIVQDDESNLLSIILIVLGLAIMGGAGYFLYEQNEEKKATQARIAAAQMQMSQSRARPGAPVMPRQAAVDPQMAAKFAQESAVRQAALRQEYDKRLAEKEIVRKQMLQGFAENVGKRDVNDAKGDVNDAKGNVAGGVKTSAGKRPGSGDSNDDDYVDLTALGSKKIDGSMKSEKTDNTTNKSVTGALDKANVDGKANTDGKKSRSAFDDLGKVGK